MLQADQPALGARRAGEPAVERQQTRVQIPSQRQVRGVVRVEMLGNVHFRLLADVLEREA